VGIDPAILVPLGLSGLCSAAAPKDSALYKMLIKQKPAAVSALVCADLLSLVTAAACLAQACHCITINVFARQKVAIANSMALATAFSNDGCGAAACAR